MSATFVCSGCKKECTGKAYQAETGNWVTPGKFPTFDFCGPGCGKAFRRRIFQGAPGYGMDLSAQASYGDICETCGIGYYLPSNVCDHCNQPRR